MFTMEKKLSYMCDDPPHRLRYIYFVSSTQNLFVQIQGWHTVANWPSLDRSEWMNLRKVIGRASKHSQNSSLGHWAAMDL